MNEQIVIDIGMKCISINEHDIAITNVVNYCFTNVFLIQTMYLTS